MEAAAATLGTMGRPIPRNDADERKQIVIVGGCGFKVCLPPNANHSYPNLRDALETDRD